MTEEEHKSYRGGTEATAPTPVEEQGQSIMINACLDGHPIWPEAPSLAKEFLEQLEESKAPTGCIMLPGNLQYWKPCKWIVNDYKNSERKGTKAMDINEPMHFCGPSP